MILDFNTTILLILINQENLKWKHQWWHWAGEVFSINWSDRSYKFSLYWLTQSIMSIILIVSMASIALILEFSITVRWNWKVIQMNQQTLGLTFGVKRGNFLRLLAFTGICKYFTRSIWEINKTPLGVMTSYYPQGKSLPLETFGVVIPPPDKRELL